MPRFIASSLRLSSARGLMAWSAATDQVAPSDNRLSNLRWDTRLANHADKVAAGTSKKTHCKHGHEFTPENTRMCTALTTGYVYKRCITCTKKRNHENYLLRSRKAS